MKKQKRNLLYFQIYDELLFLLQNHLKLVVIKKIKIHLLQQEIFLINFMKY
jgi:hypothetical protein